MPKPLDLTGRFRREGQVNRMISSDQCRAGRAFLGFSYRRLAAASGISVNELTKFERGLATAPSVGAAICNAFDRMGVDFETATDCETVRLRRNDDAPFTGDEATGR